MGSVSKFSFKAIAVIVVLYGIYSAALAYKADESMLNGIVFSVVGLLYIFVALWFEAHELFSESEGEE